VATCGRVLVRTRVTVVTLVAGIATAGCGGDGLSAEDFAERFQERTGITLDLQEAHEGEDHADEEEVFLEPARLTPADVARYGRFTLVFWPESPLVDGVWNRDYRGWAYQTTYGDVSLLWHAGRDRARDARWRRLDGVVRRLVG
jgi:hypothetical protein